MMADDNKPIHELRFDAAVKVIQSLPADGKNKTKFELQDSWCELLSVLRSGPKE